MMVRRFLEIHHELDFRTEPCF